MVLGVVLDVVEALTFVPFYAGNVGQHQRTEFGYDFGLGTVKHAQVYERVMHGVDEFVLVHDCILGTEPDLVSQDLDASIERQMLHTAIDSLSTKERFIVGLRYGFNAGKQHTQKEVADMMGISQSYISRLEKRIIGKLREELLRMA